MAIHYLLDANVLLRFLCADHAVHSPAARALVAEAAQGGCQLVLSETCVAEAVWVLTTYYRKDRNFIARILSKFIQSPGIRTLNRTVVLDALQRFAAVPIDYLDCHLAAVAASHQMTVASFDRDLDQFKDIVRFEPKPSQPKE